MATITGKCIFIRNFIVSEAREINNAELSDYNPVRLRRERAEKRKGGDKATPTERDDATELAQLVAPGVIKNTLKSCYRLYNAIKKG